MSSGKIGRHSGTLPRLEEEGDVDEVDEAEEGESGTTKIFRASPIAYLAFIVH